MLHELIDRDDSCCLFCDARLEFGSYTEWIRNKTYTTETLSCTKCPESFQIHSVQLEDGETVYKAFSFTVNGIHVLNEYDECVVIGKKLVPWPMTNNNDLIVPEFDIDFSNKDKLYEKVKTYLLFS